MSDADTYVALPGGGPAPGIVMLPAIFGIDAVARAVADRWAARGFVVVAANQFRRDAEPGVMERTDEGRAAAQARGKRVDVDRAVADVGETIAALRAMPECNGKVAVAGFCFGGRYAYLAAARLDVDAAAGFHPTQITQSLADAPNVHAPLQLHFGAEDPLTPKDDVDAVAEALAGKPDVEIYVYLGATHNFALPGVPGYDKAAAELSDQRAFAMFDELKG